MKIRTVVQGMQVFEKHLLEIKFQFQVLILNFEITSV